MHRRNVSIGEFDETTGMTRLTQCRVGTFLCSMLFVMPSLQNVQRMGVPPRGAARPNWYLFPEEAVYLLDRVRVAAD
jgi:hypothetical protein